MAHGFGACKIGFRGCRETLTPARRAAAPMQCPLCMRAFLLVVCFSGAICAAEKTPLTAIVITAKTDLPGDTFADSTVLVLNNMGPAPVGLITNRPTKFTVSHLFPELEPRLAQVRERIY